MRSTSAAAPGPPADAAASRLPNVAHKTAHNQPGEDFLQLPCKHFQCDEFIYLLFA